MVDRKKNKNLFSERTVNCVVEDLCFRTFRYPTRKILRSKKALLTPEPLSRHALVAFRDGQRIRVGFAQKFKFEFKSPRVHGGIKEREWDVKSPKLKKILCCS